MAAILTSPSAGTAADAPVPSVTEAVPDPRPTVAFVALDGGTTTAEVRVLAAGECDDDEPRVLVIVPEWPLSPDAARQLATRLLVAADRADGLPPLLTPAD